MTTQTKQALPSIEEIYGFTWKELRQLYWDHSDAIEHYRDVRKACEDREIQLEREALAAIDQAQNNDELFQWLRKNQSIYAMNLPVFNAYETKYNEFNY